MLFIPESQLPLELTPPEAVEAAYATELADVASDLRRGLPALVECDKDLVPYLFMNLRTRLKQAGWQCVFLDGRPREDTPPGMPQTFVSIMLAQLRDAVRGAVHDRVVVLPHLDLMTTSTGGLTSEAREMIPLLYENPALVWLGFKDPSFPLPRVIENLFPRRYSILGIARPRLQHLVTQREARKLGKGLDCWSLYKHVSGMNAARLRQLLATLEGEDYPDSPKHALTQIRQATMSGQLEMPQVDLDADIGGYQRTKTRLRREILDVLAAKDKLQDEAEIAALEDLIPRGMIFWGPPGTGKTMFAKAIATAIGAAITIVSGPELKSRWVGESEENLRQIFHKARQSAPSIIVFDELDSFASARGTYTGSGVEHSMVNQLLTEMDGFRKEELVFVVGTTNFVESLDPALLRPGRFEFHLDIPYPDAEDRREILKIYDQSMRLQFTPAALEFAVKRTGEVVEGSVDGTRFSGDHINALCRALARIRLRQSLDLDQSDKNETERSMRLDADRPTHPEDIEQALSEWSDRPEMTPDEERVVATHEAGHAVCSLFCEHSTPIDRISIRGDSAGALGFVKYQDRAHRYIITRGQLIDDLCILMGGREAELLLLEDVSIGSSEDLRRATSIARALVEEFGMGTEEVGVGRFAQDGGPGQPHRDYSPALLEAIDTNVRQLLDEARTRSAELIATHRNLVTALRDELLEKKVLEAGTLQELCQRP